MKPSLQVNQIIQSSPLFKHLNVGSLRDLMHGCKIHEIVSYIHRYPSMPCLLSSVANKTLDNEAEYSLSLYSIFHANEYQYTPHIEEALAKFLVQGRRAYHIDCTRSHGIDRKIVQKLMSTTVTSMTPIISIDLCNVYVEKNGIENLSLLIKESLFSVYLNLSELRVSWLIKNGSEVIKSRWLHVLAPSLKDSLLVVLDLSNTKLDDTDMEALGLALEQNRSLNILNLSCNEISDVGLNCIPISLKYNHILALHLSDNKIGGKGVLNLALALQDSPLMWLDLTGNAITDLGLRCLSLILNKSCLVSLHLENNSITDLGAQILLNTLGYNDNLLILSLGNNKISVDVRNQIESCINYNRHIHLEMYEYTKSVYDFFCRERLRIETNCKGKSRSEIDKEVYEMKAMTNNIVCCTPAGEIFDRYVDAIDIAGELPY